MDTVKKVSAGLREDPENVLKHLGVDYKKDGGAALIGDAYGTEGKSCRVELRGANRGLIYDFAASEGADMLTLWKNVKGIPLSDAIREAKAFLGISTEDRFEKNRASWRAFPKKSRQEVQRLPMNETDAVACWLRSRGITDETIRRFAIGGKPGPEGKWIAVFPHISVRKELVNCSYRVAGEKKIWQEKDCAPTLFGWQALTEGEIERGVVIICEGHIDALTWRQAGFPVLSLPSGSGMGWIEHDWSDLEVFGSIYLSMDEDEAGSKHFDRIVKRLGVWRCHRIKLEKKDANEELTAGGGVKALREAVAGASAVRPEKVVSISQTADEIDARMNPKEELGGAIKHEEIRRHGDEGFLFRPGGVSIWTGYAGHGKSTLLSWLLSLDVAKGRKVFVASLEQTAGITGATFLRQVTGRNRLSTEEIRAETGRLSSVFYLFRECGGSDCAEVFEGMEYCFHRFGCDVFVVDNLMMLTAERMDDRMLWQVDWLKKLINFVQLNDVHVHLVAHPKKTDEAEAPKTFDIFGASQLGNLVDNIVAVHRQFSKAGELKTGDVAVYSRKQRVDGWTGRIKLFFDKPTERFSLAAFNDTTKQVFGNGEDVKDEEHESEEEHKRGAPD